jgi:hypothetical protein
VGHAPEQVGESGEVLRAFRLQPIERLEQTS